MRVASNSQPLERHDGSRDKLRAHLAMLLFAMLIAGSFSFGKLALPFVDPAPLNAMRFALGSALMAGFVFGLRKQTFAVPVQPWRYVILGGLMAIYFLTMFTALTMISPVSTSAVFTLTPIFAAVFGYLILKQIVRPILGLSLLFAAIGSVWVIFRGDLAALLAFDVGQGELIYLFGCACHALYAPLVRKFNRGEPVLVATFWSLVATTVCITFYGFQQILATDWASLPVIAWSAIIYLAIFTTAGTTFLVMFASLRIPASKVMAYGYLTPVGVIVIEGAIGHGWMNVSVAIGALVTCLGLLVLYFSPDS